MGTIFIDTLMALFILSVGAAAFFSLMPVLKRSKEMAHEQAIALQMSNRMIDQLQMLKSTQVNGSYLAQLKLIDAGQSSSPYSFTHIPLDNATNYSPGQALNKGKGILTITNVDNGSVMVNIEIDWTSADKKLQSLKTGTVIGGYR